MRFLIFFIFGLFLNFGVGCSGNDGQDESSKGAKTPASEMDASGQDSDDSTAKPPKVVPFTLSPEDQEKAGQAPDGMVFIKGGCFIMGNDYAQEDEKPEHEVCLDDFYMDKYEVTQARWEKRLGFNPSKIIGPELPVEQVNFFEAQEFLAKSNGQCRLPTEAEWEYAAKGGADTRYFWGNMMDEAYAWYKDGSAETTHPVGQKQPNQYGLYDMMGNVWEWTNDWYEPYYQIRGKNNTKGPQTGEFKVIRGGAFDSSAGALRITNRIWLHPKNRVFLKVTTYGQAINEVYNYIGFRCAQSLPVQPKATKK